MVIFCVSFQTLPPITITCKIEINDNNSEIADEVVYVFQSTTKKLIIFNINL